MVALAKSDESSASSLHDRAGGPRAESPRAEAEVCLLVETTLREAGRAAARRVRWITVPCILAGSFLMLTGSILKLAYIGVLPKEFSYTASLAVGLGIVCALLALVPTQARSVWLVTAIMMVSCVGLIAMGLLHALLLDDIRSSVPVLKFLEKEVPDYYARTFFAFFLISLVLPVLVLASCVRLMLQRPPMRRHIRILWMTIDGVMVFLFFQFSLEATIHAVAGYLDLNDYLLNVLDSLYAGAIALLLAWPGLRLRVQAWLAEQGSGTNVAMAVGALVSSRSLEELLPLAKKRFRCVPLDRVTRAAMALNAPDRALADLTEPATLGEVDAFVSHSWSDDPDAKWEELQAWREDFRTAAGREPRVWIDKFCIDQGDIANALAGLPIFLAGCEKLVVLHGETYQTRLWCLLEIFTFIVMGGSTGNLEVRQLRTCEIGFDRFDARSATCTNGSDRMHLLGIIETGLGTVDVFNAAVRDMVGKRVSSRRPAAVQAPIEALPSKCEGEGEDRDGEDEDGEDEGEEAPDSSIEDLALALSKVIVFEDEDMFSF